MQEMQVANPGGRCEQVQKMGGGAHPGKSGQCRAGRRRDPRGRCRTPEWRQAGMRNPEAGPSRNGRWQVAGRQAVQAEVCGGRQAVQKPGRQAAGERGTCRGSDSKVRVQRVVQCSTCGGGKSKEE